MNGTTYRISYYYRGEYTEKAFTDYGAAYEHLDMVLQSPDYTGVLVNQPLENAIRGR